MPSIFDLFKVLSKGARAALPFLEGAAETIKTASEILEEAKELGFTIRRQTGLDIIGALRGKLDTRRYLRLTPHADILNPDFFTKSVTGLLRNYSYTVLARLHDEETGETLNQHITVSSNEALSQEQIMERASEFSLSGKYGPNLFMDDIAVTDAMRSPALG